MFNQSDVFIDDGGRINLYVHWFANFFRHFYCHFFVIEDVFGLVHPSNQTFTDYIIEKVSSSQYCPVSLHFEILKWLIFKNC